jgi:uncharacterized RDD family membrane protein YckC
VVAPSAPRYAHFGIRVVALTIDLAILALLFVVLVSGVNAFAAQWNERWLDPLWSKPEVVNVRVESVGAPETVKHDDGIERTTAFSRETRLYADGSVRIFAVIEGRARLADGTETSGRAENLIGESSQSYWRTRATYAVFALLAMLYSGLFEASRHQGTPGKRVFRVVVADLAGQPLSPWRALWRQITKLVTVAMSGLGYLPALFTQRQQTIHDLLAGTIVIYARSAALAPRQI